jgi:hypothetical protein
MEKSVHLPHAVIMLRIPLQRPLTAGCGLPAHVSLVRLITISRNKSGRALLTQLYSGQDYIYPSKFTTLLGKERDEKNKWNVRDRVGGRGGVC